MADKIMALDEVFGIAPAADEEQDEPWMNLDDLPSQMKPPVPAVKRGRGKLILLEDILKDKKKKLRISTRKAEKVKKIQRGAESSSDEGSSSGEQEEDVKKYDDVEEKLNTFGEILAETESEGNVKWGEKVFGPREPFPDFTLPENDTGLISRVMNFEPQEGTGRMSTIATMASTGLLLSWAALERRCDKTTARWLFHQMAYSGNGFVEKSTCKILCDLLLKKTRDGKPVCIIEWVPSFVDIMDTFRVYGYLDACEDDEPIENTGSGRYSVAEMPSQGEQTPFDPTGEDEREGPPSNIRSLLQFLVPYVQSRKWYSFLSTPEAESLVLLLIRCGLDRCMVNVSNLLGSCFGALIDYFTEEEWTSSCEALASTISRASPSFLNNLRVARSLHATNNRFRSLQRLVVLQLLTRRVEAKRDLTCPEDVVAIFKSVNTKDKACNFLNLHYLLFLADIYLWSDSSVTKKARVFAAWLDLLKKCATQISLQDPRPYSMKVRNWASFLSQKYQIENMQTNSAPQ